MAFRDAHAVVGHAVLYCIENGRDLEQLSMNEFQTFSELIKEDVYDFIDVKQCVAKRKIPGGPAPETVSRALQEAGEWIKKMKE